MHVSREEMIRFCDGNLGFFRRLCVVWHLKRCPACRELKEKTDADTVFLDEFRRSVQTFETIEKTLSEVPEQRSDSE